MDWELIRQQKNTQINRDNTHKYRHKVEYDFKVGDKVMLNKHTAYKYETIYKGPFLITHYFTNVVVNLQRGPTKIKYNIRRIKS